MNAGGQEHCPVHTTGISYSLLHHLEFESTHASLDSRDLTSARNWLLPSELVHRMRRGFLTSRETHRITCGKLYRGDWMTDGGHLYDKNRITR